MPATHQCRGCGADVPVNAPFGHCPKCLLELGFGPAADLAETPSPPTLVAGRSFGEYELIEQIGRGGMGVIFKARQRSLNRLVALKLVSSGEFASPTMVQRFHLEAEAAASLHHPNIVPIYETGEIHGQHFFSMELIDGAGLDRYITGSGFCFGNGSGADKASQRARQEQTARLIAKVAGAVNYAHLHGVLHRDIKPSNIILDSHGEPHLTDFGVAKVLGHTGSGLTASGAIIGTPSYMAPEQAAGNTKHVTIAADIYSLGAVLYGMLTGHPPFRGDTPVQTLKQVVEQEPKHPSTLNEGVDRDLANICLKCMEKEPARRYHSASALAEDLDRWLRGEPIYARPASAGERFWRWCRRNPRVAALGATVVMLLILMAAGATAVAIHINGLHADKLVKNAELRHYLVVQLDALYEAQGPETFVIPSSTRRALADKPRIGGSPLQITFVEHIYEHPTNMLSSLAPILNELEDQLARVLTRPVAIDMRLVQSPADTYAAMESTEAAFGRMGPASFATLDARSNGVRLLVTQAHKKPLTLGIYTRADGPVARLADALPTAKPAILLSNQTLALTHSNSTTGNFLPKWFLASEGIRATNLAGYEYLGSQRQARDAVGTNRCSVGAGNLDIIEGNPALRILAKLEVPNLGRCWVAGRGLNSLVETNIRASLLQMRDPVIFDMLESEVSGFTNLNPATLDRLRQIMREAANFDAGTNSPAP